MVLQWLTTDDIQLNQIDADEPEVSDHTHIPHVAKLADRPRVCLKLQ